MNPNEIDKIELDFLKLEDYLSLKDAMVQAYPSMPENYWRESQIKKLLNKFPEGQAVIKINGELAGCTLSIIVNFNNFDNNHTYKEATGNYTFSTHTGDGDVLYGIEVFIKPEFRGLRLGRRLYDYRKELCEKLNLKGIVFGGRIPNYHKYAKEFSPKEYIDKVKQRRLTTRCLTFKFMITLDPLGYSKTI